MININEVAKEALDLHKKISLYNKRLSELKGIILASSMLLVAMFYERLLNIISFFKISLFVELVMFVTLLVFFFYQISFISALTIYCLYQITFIFGGYLVRAETLVANDKEYLGKIDILKQIGY